VGRAKSVRPSSGARGGTDGWSAGQWAGEDGKEVWARLVAKGCGGAV
jgi:hypothetical protein